MMESEVFRKILPAEFHRRFLIENRRADGRAFHCYRQPVIATNVLSNCSGSASVRCGNSYYLAGVRCEVGRPVEERGIQLQCRPSQPPSVPTKSNGKVFSADSMSPSALACVHGMTGSSTFTEGQVSVSVEFPKVCGAEFRDFAGPCTQIPLLVSNIVTDLLNSPAVLDKRQLVLSYSNARCGAAAARQLADLDCMQPDNVPEYASETTAPRVAKAEAVCRSEPTSATSASYVSNRHKRYAPPQYAWHLFVHVLCLEYDGNPLDFAVLAAVAALEDTCLPGVFWDENAKWWRHMPPDIGVNGSSSTSKLESSGCSEGSELSVPLRKIRLLERPVAVTFSHLLSAYWVVDPTREEEALGCWLTILFIKDKWEITRFGGPPIRFDIIKTLKTVAGVIVKGVRSLKKVSG